MKKRTITTFILTVCAIILFSQESSSPDDLKREKALDIFIDCRNCDQEYFKQNFTIVNYVRDRKEANVHIITTKMQTGGGGSEFSLLFIGLANYSFLTDTISYFLPSNYTEDENRKAMLKHIQLGLVPYILKTDFADKLILKIENETKEIDNHDPWKNWVFNIRSYAYGEIEKTYSRIYISSGIFIQKVTPEIKFESIIHHYYSVSNYKQYDGDTLAYSSISQERTYRFENLLSKSIGNHWGIGGFVNLMHSSYRNYKIRTSLLPTIEYNFFSYEQATRKQLRFMYSIGYSYYDYIDTTVYNKMQEGLFNHEIRIIYKQVEKWGNIETSALWTNFFHDFKLYMFSLKLSGEIRIFKGLSFNVRGFIDIPRNQISLRKGEVTTEDILLRQQEMQTDYYLGGSIGISYTFGSIYNNTVNPRFDL